MKTTNAIIFAIAIVLFAAIAGNYYYKRCTASRTISVTGLGEVNFTSDLIVWSGNFSETAPSLEEAYAKLDKDRQIIIDYLKNNGLSDNEIIVEAVGVDEEYKDQYSPDGKYIGQKFAGYTLSQDITISSSQVDLVEDISRKITELINQGIDFTSYQPSYYYTHLADLKLELIKDASENARKRAENMIEGSGAKLGKLVNASMGVFQITGLYSNEDYSWGGTYNTTSKNKTARITVHQVYMLK